MSRVSGENIKHYLGGYTTIANAEYSEKKIQGVNVKYEIGVNFFYNFLSNFFSSLEMRKTEG